MSKESSYSAAQTLLSEGWRAEKTTIVVKDGSRRQGWRWTDPLGGVSEVAGKWDAGPTKPKKVKLPPTWHMKWKEVSPRNSVFLKGTLPTPCEVCGDPFPERSLLAYGSIRCCAGCFAAKKVEVEREEYRKATFAVRARSYMQSRQIEIGIQNSPEIMP